MPLGPAPQPRRPGRRPHTPGPAGGPTNRLVT